MVNCCVPHCSSYRNTKYHVKGGDYVSYHEFPCDLTLREQWLKAIPRKDFTLNDKSNSSRLCSKHFKSEDFNNYKNRRKLKPGSIPSVFEGYPKTSFSALMKPKKTKLEPSKSAHMEPKKIKLEPLEMVEVQENEPDLTANEETYTEPELIVGVVEIGQITSVFDGYPTCMPTSTSSSGCTEQLESSEMREVQENDTDQTANNEETSTEHELIFSSIKKELKKKDFALEEKSKLLHAKMLEIRKLKRQLKNKSKQLENVPAQIEGMERDLNYYTNSIHHRNLKRLLDMQTSGCIEPKQVLLLTQLKFMFSKSFRWPDSVLEECNLLQSVSPCGYKMLVERDLMNLPSRSTLQRYTIQKYSTANSFRKSSPAAKFNHSNMIMCCHHRVLIVLY